MISGPLIKWRRFVSSAVTIDHSAIAHWIANALWESSPGAHVVGTGETATLDGRHESRLDVVVTRAGHARRTPLSIADALLVVEVASPISPVRDAEMRRARYAGAGLSAYWIVVPEEELPTIALVALALDAGARRYRYVAHYTTDVFDTESPWRLRLDLPALTDRRAVLMGQPPAG